MRVQYDVMVQEFTRVLEKRGFNHEAVSYTHLDVYKRQVLGFVAVRYGDAFFLIVYHMIPTLIREILLWILLAGMALDISASLAAVFHIRKEMPTAIRWNKKVAVWTQKFALMIVGHVEKRMAKAYPVRCV